MDFTHKEGSGIRKLLPHVSSECVELIEKLLIYNPDERPTARQALKHPYFRELREKDEMMRKITRVPRSFDSKSPSKSDDGSIVGSSITEKMGKLKEHSVLDDDEARMNVSPPVTRSFLR